jgi:Asp-tRNA(Asn)/Glu-tRNA(Gln) amidotransferase A subunit family amidase
VAAGYFPFAYGTQTAGSVIRPAAYCGVVGYKPTYNTIDRHGMKLMAFSLDTIGTMARSVADCALLAAAVSRRDLGDPERSPDRPLRIGVCRSPAWAQADAATQALLTDSAARLARAGAIVSDLELPESFAAVMDAQVLVMSAESASSLAWEMAVARDQLSEGLRDRMEWGLAQSPEALDAALAVMRGARLAFAGATADVDVLLTPSAPGEAPEGIAWTGDPAFNALWTALHVPCVTVPAGTGPAGMPLGIQLVGRLGEDRAVLAAAHWVGAALAWG